jgi:phosphate acyltransferase
VAPMMLGILQQAGVDASRLTTALKDLDYSEHGGAPLLGVRGVSIISHGKSSPRAIKNALKVAVRAVDSRMNEHIGRRLESVAGEGEAA